MELLESVVAPKAGALRGLTGTLSRFATEGSRHLLTLGLCPLLSRQYSSGSKIQVDERSASVITQILTPVILSVYTDINRNPCSSES